MGSMEKWKEVGKSWEVVGSCGKLWEVGGCDWLDLAFERYRRAPLAPEESDPTLSGILLGVNVSCGSSEWWAAY